MHENDEVIEVGAICIPIYGPKAYDEHGEERGLYPHQRVKISEVWISPSSGQYLCSFKTLDGRLRGTASAVYGVWFDPVSPLEQLAAEA